MSTPLEPYISRLEAEELLLAFAKALENPTASPTVFHIWGIGGVGKTTLLRQLRAAHQGNTVIAQVILGRTEGIQNPIALMAKLYEQIVPHDAWSRDPFWDRYDLYFETIKQLETQPVTKRGTVDETQVKQVKTLLRLGVDTVGKVFLSPGQETLIEQVVERGTEAAVAGLSLKDDLVQLVQQHQATQRDAALKKLMLEPLIELTQAFVDGLRQQAQPKPVVLVLDTYEKVSPILDTWLWRTLLGNTRLMHYPVRLVIAGRHNIRRTEGWRKLHQDTHCLCDRTFERFTLAQTTHYLTQIGITNAAEIQNIYQVTKGLPYYLNWVREQREKGLTLNFAEGNQEIVRLLLEGLNGQQKLLVQIAACCRWFDLSLIRCLAEQHGLDFDTAVDETRNCFNWLVQQNFVETTGDRWRLDDVARDVFRRALRQADREKFEQIQVQLTDYFQGRSRQAVAPEASLPDQYENPEWCASQSEYLYYLLFSRRPDGPTQWIAHLLEARFFDCDELLQTPIQALLAEGALDEELAYLNYTTRKFLKEILPAVLQSWAVLEEVPIDYGYNQANYGLSKTAIDMAVQRCLANPDQFEGLAKFMALLCKAKRCPPAQQPSWLRQAQAQAATLSPLNPPSFWVDLYVWKLGNAFYTAHLYEAALASYNQAIALKPHDAQAFYIRGNVLDDLGRKEAALDSYNQAIALKPDLAPAFYNRGIVLSDLGRYEAALESYNQAIALQPENANAFANRGNVLSALGRKAAALESYNQAIARQPDDAQTFFNQGNVLSDLGRKAAALESYNQAIALEPKGAQAFANRGMVLDDLGRYEEALESCNQAIALKPDLAQAFVNRGVVLDALGRYEAALASYNQAIALKPDLAPALSNRGVVLDALGRKEEALESYNQAIALQPENTITFYNRGVVLDALGRYAEALESYNQAIARQPDYVQALSNRGDVLDALGRYEEALDSYNQAIARQPNDAKAFSNRGNVLSALGRKEEALESYNQAIALQPEDTTAFYNRGDVLLTLGCYQEALDSYNRAIALQPEDANTFYNKACCHALQNELEQALGCLQRAIALDPEQYGQSAETDSDFDSIRHYPGFQSLIQPFANQTHA